MHISPAQVAVDEADLEDEVHAAALPFLSVIPPAAAAAAAPPLFPPSVGTLGSG